MRKKCNRIISSLIAFVFVLNLNVSVFAATDSVNSSDPKSNSIEFRNDEGMEIKIDIIENENEIIVKEYDDGILVSTVEGEKGDTVFTKTEGDKVETVDYSDYVDVDNGTEKKGSTRKNLGTMSYRVDGNKIDVTCKTEERVSTYNIKNFTGKVIDLVVILAGSLSLPSILSKQFVQALIWNGFLYVSSNEVKKVVGIETLAATATDNSFEICDSKNTRNKERFNGGTEYIITETGSSRVNEKYKDGGFVESDFNTRSFKAFCHKQIFGTISNDENIY